MNDMALSNRDFAREETDRLAVDFQHIGSQVRQLLDGATELPPSVTDQASNNAFADYVTKVRATLKSIEGSRVAEKDPILKRERAVDGFFAALAKPLETLALDLHRQIKAFLDQEAAKERAERLRLAQEARRIEEERAEEARREAAKAASAKRQDHKALHEERALRASNEAAEASDRAAVHTESASVKPAALVRNRSEVGTLSTLKTVWNFVIEDEELIPMDALRPYIPKKVLESAIRSAVAMGVRSLSGVRIFEGTQAVVR